MIPCFKFSDFDLNGLILYQETDFSEVGKEQKSSLKGEAHTRGTEALL